MLTQYAAEASSYVSDVGCIMGANAMDMMDAPSGRSFTNCDDAPKLALVNGGNVAEGEIAILDANGNVVPRAAH